MSCPDCGDSARCVGQRSKGVTPLLGLVHLERHYYHCPTGGHGHFPWDDIPRTGGHRLTPGAREVVCLAGIQYRFGRKSGLQDADAADLTQIVLVAVNGSVGRLDYEPAKGTFRSWLFGVARNQLSKWRRGQREPQGGGNTEHLERLHTHPAPDDAAGWWEMEFKRQRFLVAAERVRPVVNADAWQAFWQTAVDGRDAADVAAELNIKLGALYTAKSRVLALIKKEIETLDED